MTRTLHAASMFSTLLCLSFTAPAGARAQRATPSRPADLEARADADTAPAEVDGPSRPPSSRWAVRLSPPGPCRTEPAACARWAAPHEPFRVVPPPPRPAANTPASSEARRPRRPTAPLLRRLTMEGLAGFGYGLLGGLLALPFAVASVLTRDSEWEWLGVPFVFGGWAYGLQKTAKGYGVEGTLRQALTAVLAGTLIPSALLMAGGLGRNDSPGAAPVLGLLALGIYVYGPPIAYEALAGTL